MQFIHGGGTVPHRAALNALLSVTRQVPDLQPASLRPRSQLMNWPDSQIRVWVGVQRHDLQNILRQFYDHLTIIHLTRSVIYLWKTCSLLSFCLYLCFYSSTVLQFSSCAVNEPHTHDSCATATVQYYWWSVTIRAAFDAVHVLVQCSLGGRASDTVYRVAVSGISVMRARWTSVALARPTRYCQGRLNRWAYWVRAQSPLFFSFWGAPTGCGEINF